MADVLHIDDALEIPLEEVHVRASRSSGPGGQHANVTASRIEASFDVAASAALDESQKARITARCGPVVRAVAQDARSQARNRALALERLAARPASDEAHGCLAPPAAGGQAAHVGAQARPPAPGRRMTWPPALCDADI